MPGCGGVGNRFRERGPLPFSIFQGAVLRGRRLPLFHCFRAESHRCKEPGICLSNLRPVFRRGPDLPVIYALGQAKFHCGVLFRGIRGLMFRRRRCPSTVVVKMVHSGFPKGFHGRILPSQGTGKLPSNPSPPYPEGDRIFQLYVPLGRPRAVGANSCRFSPQATAWWRMFMFSSSMSTQ